MLLPPGNEFVRPSPAFVFGTHPFGDELVKSDSVFYSLCRRIIGRTILLIMLGVTDFMYFVERFCFLPGQDTIATCLVI